MQRFLILLIAALSMPAWAATLAVPGSYTTIRDAVNNAVDGDTIEVQPGTYAESRIELDGGATGLIIQKDPLATGEVVIIPTSSRLFDVKGGTHTVRDLTIDGDTSGSMTRAIDVHSGNMLMIERVILKNIRGDEGAGPMTTSRPTTSARWTSITTLRCSIWTRRCPISPCPPW